MTKPTVSKAGKAKPIHVWVRRCRGALETPAVYMSHEAATRITCRRCRITEYTLREVKPKRRKRGEG